MKSNQSHSQAGILSKASETSYLVQFIAGCFLLVIRLVGVLYKAFTAFQGEPTQAKTLRPMVAPAGVKPAADAGTAVAAPKPQAPSGTALAGTVISAPQKDDFVAASRVRIANLTPGGNVNVARIWFYLYEDQKIIKRVFRPDDHQLRKLMGCDRYYMTNVPWDPKTGEAGIDSIIKSSTEDVVRLVNDRHALRAGKPKGGARKEQAAAPVKFTVAKPEQEVAKPAPIPVKAEAPKVEAKPVPAVVKESVARPVEGQEYIGTVAEMGSVPRSGGRNGTYNAFCLKLEKGGVHSTFYGVELEREILEHAVKAGDKVSVVYMGRQELPQQNGASSWKNLYKVKVINRGA